MVSNEIKPQLITFIVSMAIWRIFISIYYKKTRIKSILICLTAITIKIQKKKKILQFIDSYKVVNSCCIIRHWTLIFIAQRFHDAFITKDISKSQKKNTFLSLLQFLNYRIKLLTPKFD